MSRPIIAVSIANYRDAETPHTVKDLIAKADNPELIRVLVLSQVDKWTDAGCLPEPNPLVLSAEVPHDTSKGVCWARSEILTKLLPMLDVEPMFVLQIDSHSRFVQGWDTLALVNYMNCRDTRAVLSCYPTGYVPEEPLGEVTYTPHRIKDYNLEGLPRFGSASYALEFAPKEPQRNACLAGGCLFTTLEILRAVPYDPYLYFGGEEFTLAVRLFTHGYNVYTPNQPWMYHRYEDTTKTRPRHWKDNTDWGARNRLSMLRWKHLLGIEPTRNPDALRDFERYCLGGVRTAKEYQEFAGIDYLNKLVTEKSISGAW